jgi:hypothetical protein
MTICSINSEKAVMIAASVFLFREPLRLLTIKVSEVAIYLFFELIAEKSIYYAQEMEKSARLNQYSKELEKSFIFSLCPERINVLNFFYPVFEFIPQIVKSIDNIISASFINEDSVFSTLRSNLAEVIFFRSFLQLTLFREIPRYLMKKFTPNHANQVDHVIIKLFRIVIVGTINSLSNIDYWQCIKGGTMHTVPAGMFIGALTELKAPIINNMIKVEAINSLAFLILISYFQNGIFNHINHIVEENQKLLNQDKVIDNYGLLMSFSLNFLQMGKFNDAVEVLKQIKSIKKRDIAYLNIIKKLLQYDKIEDAKKAFDYILSEEIKVIANRIFDRYLSQKIK